MCEYNCRQGPKPTQELVHCHSISKKHYLLISSLDTGTTPPVPKTILSCTSCNTCLTKWEPVSHCSLPLRSGSTKEGVPELFVCSLETLHLDLIFRRVFQGTSIGHFVVQISTWPLLMGFQHSQCNKVLEHLVATRSAQTCMTHSSNKKLNNMNMDMRTMHIWEGPWRNSILAHSLLLYGHGDRSRTCSPYLMQTEGKAAGRCSYPHNIFCYPWSVLALFCGTFLKIKSCNVVCA